MTLTLMVDGEEYIRTFEITISGPDAQNAILETCAFAPEVVAISTPEFDLVTEYFFSETAQALPGVSENGISGSWEPSGIDINANEIKTYTFTPHPQQCSRTFQVEIKVASYPKFFTPNNDGYNDQWNISALHDQGDAKIRIYDRYGKILTQIQPQGPGWNGNYNGKQMPSSDYWFVLDYQDSEGMPKEFKAHFSLKR